MEETVGLRLFHREHNRLYPTNAGKVFVNNARNILRMEAELDRVIKDYRRDHGGRLFVHCDSTLLSLFAEVVTPAFSSLYPDIQLTVVESCSGTSREALLSSSTDFALFMTCTPKQTELHCEILGLTELVYCADPARPLSGLRGGDPLPSPLEPRSVMLASAGTTLRAEQDRLYEEIFELPPHIVCQAEFALLRRLAALGGAGTILPLHMLPISEHSHCFSLQPPQPYYLVLAYYPGKTMSPVERQLYTLIQHTFKGFFCQPDIALS
jgi:DNA-binding transcriptional LysR family regulator